MNSRLQTPFGRWLLLCVSVLAGPVAPANVAVTGTVSATGTPTATGSIVISQVYGGGGNNGATYKNDFIELFNRGSSPVDVTGWSVQYASSTGTTWQTTPLSGTIAPSKYYLIQEGAGAGGTLNLPAPDAIGDLALSASTGKIALVNTLDVLSVSCTTGINVIDFIGYGPTANCFEGTTRPATAPSNTSAVLRTGSGCTDTNNNAADFVTGAPNPRNSSSLVNSCTPTAPFLAATPSPLSLSYTQGSGPASRPVTVSARSLTPASGTVTVTSSNTAVALSYNGSAFGNAVTIPYGNSALTSTTLVAQLTAGLSPGSYPATLAFVAGGASFSLTATGTVSASASGAVTPIVSARTQLGQTVTIRGRVTASTQISSRLFYLQDSTGGVAVYSGPSPATDYATQVQLGDLVTVSAPVTVFNGFVELSGITRFSVDTSAGRTVPAPRLVALDQIGNYQGQLVRVANTTIDGVATTFTANTNYTLTSGTTTGTLRITSSSELPGAGKPSGPVSITGIAERFVAQATTTGINGVQLQPRLLVDVQGATTPVDQLCGGTGTTGLTTDQTFDVTTWNVEFFGADGGVISCTAAPTSRPYDDLGPFDEARQASNVKTVLERLNSDVYVLEEVSDAALLAQVVSTSIGSYSLTCSDRYSYYWQGDCEQTEVFLPNQLAQKVCVLYKRSTVVPVLAETKPLLADQYGYGPNGPANATTNNWSSGRLPYLFVADVTTNGLTKRLHIVGLHAKSGSAPADYARRQQDYADLKNKLQTDYPSANVLILGDYNDQADSSITTGRMSSFNNFVTDPTNFSVLTRPLEAQGCRTFESGSFLDHIVISNELFPAYIPNSANVLTPAVGLEGGYSSTTTSDHRPVTARFDLNRLNPPLATTPVSSSLEPTTPLQVLLTPHPLQDGQLRAIVQGATNQPLSVQLLDMRGQPVRQQSWPRAEARQEIHWRLNGPANGAYLLKIQTPDQTKTIRLLKAD